MRLDEVVFAYETLGTTVRLTKISASGVPIASRFPDLAEAVKPRRFYEMTEAKDGSTLVTEVAP